MNTNRTYSSAMRSLRPVATVAPGLLVALLVVGCGSDSGAAASEDQPAGGVEAPADLVLTNGKLATVDPSQPQAEALAVSGDRIVAVGSAAEIETYVGPATTVIDLGGRLAIPGFIEGHGHFMSLGQAQTILDLTTARTWDDIVAMVGEAAERAEPGEWIEGRGWHQEKWDRPPTPSVEDNPVHGSLSRVSPENPVVLGHASGHASFVNARALELAGIGRDTPDPPGGEIIRDAAGDATGLLRETAQRLVGQVQAESEDDRTPQQIEAERRLMVELAGREAIAKGDRKSVV